MYLPKASIWNILLNGSYILNESWSKTIEINYIVGNSVSNGFKLTIFIVEILPALTYSAVVDYKPSQIKFFIDIHSKMIILVT